MKWWLPTRVYCHCQQFCIVISGSLQTRPTDTVYSIGIGSVTTLLWQWQLYTELELCLCLCKRLWQASVPPRFSQLLKFWINRKRHHFHFLQLLLSDRTECKRPGLQCFNFIITINNVTTSYSCNCLSLWRRLTGDSHRRQWLTAWLNGEPVPESSLDPS